MDKYSSKRFFVNSMTVISLSIFVLLLVYYAFFERSTNIAVFCLISFYSLLFFVFCRMITFAYSYFHKKGDFISLSKMDKCGFYCFVLSDFREKE